MPGQMTEAVRTFNRRALEAATTNPGQREPPSMHGGAARLASWLSAVCAALIVGLIVSASVTLVASHRNAISTEAGNLTRIGRTLAEHTQRVIFGADLVLSALEERIVSADIPSREAFQQFAAAKSMHDLLFESIVLAPDIDAISITDSGGDILSSTRSWPAPTVNVSDRDYFSVLRDSTDRDTYVSRPLRNRATGQNSILLIRRISGQDGTFFGLAFVTIATTRFVKLFSAVLPDNQASIALYRRDGVFLAGQPHLSNIDDAGPEIKSFFFETAARAEQGNLHTAAVDGRSASEIVSLNIVRGYPLMILVANPEAVFLSEWWKLAGLIISVALVAIVLVCLLAAISVRQLIMQQRMIEATAARDAAERARSTAEAANSAKRLFLANMSHELRTPLNAVIGFSELLASKDFGSLAAQQEEYVAAINQAGTHLVDLINNLLDMSKIEAGHYRLVETAVDVRSLLQDALNCVRIDAHDRNVSLCCDAGEGGQLYVDCRALVQVIVNLLTNAVKFSKPGSTVFLAAGRDADGLVTISVRDTGPGISPAKLASIFVPFQNADSNYSRAHGGTGLGLSISKMLVDLHGGTLTIQSDLGAGTVATVCLPAARALAVR